MKILLDQNIPPVTAPWLQVLRPSWNICHVRDVGLSGKDDDTVFDWAQDHEAIIITYDEDFADRRLFSAKDHWGIVRLRVWPTTVEETQKALERLLSETSDEELPGALVIIDRSRIRIRPGRSKKQFFEK